jgi:hypothetical protein
MGLDASGNFVSEPHPADPPFPPQTGVPVSIGVGVPNSSTPISAIYIDRNTGLQYTNPTLTAGAWVAPAEGANPAVEYISDPNVENLTPADITKTAVAYSRDGSGSFYGWSTGQQKWV